MFDLPAVTRPRPNPISHPVFYNLMKISFWSNENCKSDAFLIISYLYHEGVNLSYLWVESIIAPWVVCVNVFFVALWIEKV